MNKLRWWGLAFSFVWLAACSDQTPKLIPDDKKKETVDEKIETPVVETFNPAVDILFVIDNSGSMGDHQANLSKNIDSFIQVIAQNKVLDYHIGVVTSDMDDPRQSGRLWGRSVRFVTPTTPNMIGVLRSNLQPGTSGSGVEALFDPIQAALTKPLVDTVNDGFYRENAHLALVFITDAEDQGALLPGDLWTFLLGLKKGDRDKLLSYAALVPVGDMKCPLDEGGNYSYKVFDFILNFASGKWFDLCSADYGKKLADIALDLKTKVESTIYLKRRPIINTIEVRYGTLLVPNDPRVGWTYEIGRNALLLGPEIDYASQQPGTQLEINFKSYPNQ